MRTMAFRKPRRLALTAVTGLGTVAALLAGALATPAHAAGPASGVTGKVTTSGLMLNVRTGPSTAKAQKALLRPGARFTIVCQQPGQKIVGMVRTTTMWDRLPNKTYVSDAYVTRPKTPIVRCADLDKPKIGQVMPPATPAAEGAVVSPAGWTNPIPGTVGSGYRTKARPTHDGIDIAAPKNTPIRAAAAGTVITAECNASTKNCDVDGSLKISGCGWYVEIQHVDRVVTRYCHMIKEPSVTVGDTVRAGQMIGYVGSSGNSSGPHLHFEIHSDAAPAVRANAVEPVAFLKTKGIVLR